MAGLLILPGTYRPEVLKPLSDALRNIRDDVHAALENFRTDASAYAGRAGQ